MVTFLKYKVLELFLENQAEPNKKIEIKHSFTYNVSYKADDSKCLGLLNFKITDKNDEKAFMIKVSMVSEFSYSPELDKKEIHKETFRQLFPYLRMTITNLTTLAGLPALVIPNIIIKDDDIGKQ